MGKHRLINFILSIVMLLMLVGMITVGCVSSESYVQSIPENAIIYQEVQGVPCVYTIYGGVTCDWELKSK